MLRSKQREPLLGYVGGSGPMAFFSSAGSASAGCPFVELALVFGQAARAFSGSAAEAATQMDDDLTFELIAAISRHRSA
jgi:hypothetical protein